MKYLLFRLPLKGLRCWLPSGGKLPQNSAVRNPSSNGAPELAGEHFSPVFFFFGGGDGVDMFGEIQHKKCFVPIQVQMEIAHFFSFVFLVKEHAFKLYIYMADFKDFSWNLLLSDALTFGAPSIIDRLRPLIWVTAWCEMEFVVTSVRHPR